jgi:hypothetical protein
MEEEEKKRAKIYVPIFTLLAKKMEIIRVFTIANARQANALMIDREAASPALAFFPHETLFHSRSPAYIVPALERKSEDTMEAAILALRGGGGGREGKISGVRLDEAETDEEKDHENQTEPGRGENREEAYSREKKREVLSVIKAAIKRQEQALTRERRGDSLAISKEGAMVFTSICSL